MLEQSPTVAVKKILGIPRLQPGVVSICNNWHVAELMTLSHGIKLADKPSQAEQGSWHAEFAQQW